MSDDRNGTGENHDGCDCGSGGGHGCGGDHDHDPEDGPPDPQLDPERSPGFGEDPDGLDEIEVSRDVTIGEATPEELMASDTSPVEDDPVGDHLERLRSGTKIERRRAALALADADDLGDRVAETLAGVAQTDADADVRQFAVEALGKIGGEIAERGALAVTNDDDPWVRAEAVVTVDRLDRAAHKDRLERALDDDHHAVRRNALISIFKLRGEDARDDLLSALEDPSERVREWAAHMLAGVDDDEAREALKRAATRDESGVVRTTAGNALQEDPARFRRSFRGALSEREVLLPGEDLLNRQPDL
ncbi:HEAT repeat domain-containing protein [Halostella sp. JP-L12]|uniref:HEAT repeat domain-containing protein n=1 Tax=Halostella TaxID=1843185 RepID=UPI000EF82264|nr:MULTISPECIES: HEAT repeat domain-containing protein [Halostella]NHN47767.1 HEAT repeat domain-containing protein [Halostella sp. JP-L12]